MSYRERVATRWGQAVQAARKRRGWNQTRLAEELGIARKTVGRWERGEITEPLLSQVRDIIAATGAPPEDLLRALGLLPAEAERQEGLDDDEQAIWSLGHRRGWPASARWSLIDAWRLWHMRQEREGTGTIPLAATDMATLRALRADDPLDPLNVTREQVEDAQRRRAEILRKFPHAADDPTGEY